MVSDMDFLSAVPCRPRRLRRAGLEQIASSAELRSVANLEFSRVFFRPALDHDFLFGVELDGVTSLGVHHAEEAVLPAAEREVRHRRSYPHVHTNGARGRLLAQPPRGPPAPCP